MSIVKRKIGNATLYLGDCLEVMAKLKRERYDSVCCDPPYGIAFLGLKWDLFKDKKELRGNKAFQAWTEDWASQALRVLKPGAHLLSFCGTRTYHRMASGIEDAGFEVRDQMAWMYGSGFPKGLDVGKMIGKVERGVPQGTADPDGPNHGKWAERKAIKHVGPSGIFKREHDVNGFNKKGLSKEDPRLAKMSELALSYLDWNTALKPAWEPVCLARKPLEGTVVDNVLKYGTGAMNIGACRVEHVTVGDGNLALNPHLRKGISGGNGGSIIRKEDSRRVVIPDAAGRWPANVVHDGSPEVMAAFNAFGHKKSGTGAVRRSETHSFSIGKESRAVGTEMISYGDKGSAARFFYCAKVSRKERSFGLPTDRPNKHPTVKPVALCRWLLRLATPTGGRVLDPFMGSGSMGIAALREGFKYIGIEQDPVHFETACARLQAELNTQTESATPPKKASKRRVKRRDDTRQAKKVRKQAKKVRKNAKAREYADQAT